ncbi:hypothetical protein Tco_1505861, partial [Tanacetum coccineum]
NQQQNNLVHVVKSDSEEEMEDESDAHIFDESEEEFDDPIDDRSDTMDNDGVGNMRDDESDAHLIGIVLFRDSSIDLANLLGGIEKCGARAPLNIVSWKSMPDTNLELM